MMTRRRTILLTRSMEANESIVPLFEEKGFRVLSFPTIEIRDPESWHECDEAINRLEAYDGIIFTSANAVERFILRIDDLKPEAKSLLSTTPVYSVGEKTSLRLRDLGIHVALTPDSFTADDLVESMISVDIEEKTFLFPKGDLATETVSQKLRLLGAGVDEVVVYRNVMPDSTELASIRDSLSRHEIDVVTFFSPSSVRNFLQLVSLPEQNDLLVAVIGPTTAKAAMDIGLNVDLVADQSTAESLAAAIAQHFEMNS